MTTPKREAPKWFVNLFLIALIVLLIIIIRSCASCGDSSTRRAMTLEDSAQKAFIISHQFVKQNLKAPATADFPVGDYSFSRTDSGAIIIHSYVDAQNAFGANIRSNYTAVLTWNGKEWADAGNWQLIYIDIK